MRLPTPRAARAPKPPVAAQKPAPAKAGVAQSGEESASSPETLLWGGQDTDRSLAVSTAAVEQRLAELDQPGEALGDEAREPPAEEHDASGRPVPGGRAKPGWNSPNAAKVAAPKSPLLQKQQQAHQEAVKKLAGSRTQALGQVATILSGESATNERPPDAYTLLKDAREKGVLFVEDSLQEGHSEDHDDPELAAAVEACISQCFGVRGILRIGPGRNDLNEPVIVVATTHGLTDASLAQVPAKVHRFSTLIAIPFDLLPLKRER